MFQDDFSNPDIGWQPARTAGIWSVCRYTFEYIDGEMVINSGACWPHIKARPYLRFENFILEVVGRWTDGPIGGTYGVWFRFEDDSNYYAMHIGNDGYYDIGKAGKKGWSLLLEGFSDAIDLTGGPNSFHIEANGHNLRFFINGQFLGDVYDVEHDRGDIGLVVLNAGEGSFEASFDNLIVVKHP